MKWGGCKKWTFPQRRVRYVQYQYFLFYILLIWGCLSTQRTPLPTGLKFLSLRPDRGAEYFDEYVCLCVCEFVCPRSYLRNNVSDLHQTFVHVTYGRGSVLLPRRSDTLCTSGFMDDVIFAHKLPPS